MADDIILDSRALDATLAVLASGQPASTAVRTNNPKVEDYWPVLEAGSAPGSSPWPSTGPRTTYGTNGRIFSRQAPDGWVRRYGHIFIGFLSDEFSAELEKSSGITQEGLNAVAHRAGLKMLEWLKNTAPVDSGQLHDSLELKDGV